MLNRYEHAAEIVTMDSAIINSDWTTNQRTETAIDQGPLCGSS